MAWDETHAKKLGATVRRAREARGLSQESLAYQAGITKNQVQLIEAGRGSGRRDDAGHSNPRMSTLTGIANAVGVKASELLSDSGL